jgi:uncharacterized protein YndB with AHSA1/START domain
LSSLTEKAAPSRSARTALLKGGASKGIATTAPAELPRRGGRHVRGVNAEVERPSRLVVAWSHRRDDVSRDRLSRLAANIARKTPEHDPVLGRPEDLGVPTEHRAVKGLGALGIRRL